MAGRLFILLLVGAMSIALTAQVACADQYIPLDKKFTMNGKAIDVYLLGLRMASEPLSNIHYDVDPKTVYWARLIYQFDNRGNVRDEAFITPVLVDSNGNQYRYKELEPTTVWVNPNFRTGSLFLEIPVPKNATLTEIIFLDGTVDHSFQLTTPSPTPTPTASTIPTSTPVPAEPPGWHECIPLIPFGLAGGLAACGIVINRTNIRKR